MPHALRGITKLPLASYPGSFSLTTHVQVVFPVVVSGKLTATDITVAYWATPFSCSAGTLGHDVDLLQHGESENNLAQQTNVQTTVFTKCWIVRSV